MGNEHPEDFLGGFLSDIIYSLKIYDLMCAPVVFFEIQVSLETKLDSYPSNIGYLKA